MVDSPTIGHLFLQSVRYRFEGIKSLGEKAIAQLEDCELTGSPDEETNSIDVIVRHLHGNMLSRWTDFLTTDGEKESRDRDGEFTARPATDKQALLQLWEEGWNCLFVALDSLTETDLLKEVTIRNSPLSVLDAIHRQVAHYGYHVGQIVFLAKLIRKEKWETLSIARGESKEYRPQGRD